jgi:hypothetical protein
MSPINIRQPLPTSDIDQLTLLKAGSGLCLTMVKLPDLGGDHMCREKSPAGEKWESDKNHNKTQHLSHPGGYPLYITEKPVTYSYLTHLYDGYNPAILLYLPLSDFIKQTLIHA